MSEKVARAVKRLNKILPLKERLEKNSRQIQSLYQSILKSFVSTGTVLSKHEMRSYVDDVDGTIKILDENKMIILADNGNLIGAYPFTMEERENKVRVNGFEVNAMCAVDALAVSLMYDVTTQITSRCRMTDEPIYLEQSGSKILNVDDDNDIHVCIAWEAAESDIKCADSLCMEMFFVKSKTTADTWKKVEPINREIFTLDEAINLARQFFVPLVSL